MEEREPRIVVVEDFDASTDRSAGIGLTGLLLGGAGVGAVKAAKAGFFVKLLLVFKKGLVVIGIAIAALVGKLLRRRGDS